MFAEYARSVWDGVVGQARAVDQLTRAAVSPVHAYLFVGPAGSTKHEAARAFAALLLTGHDDPEARDARLALAGEHPDVREVERTGARIAKEQVSEIIRTASLAPIEGSRKVMVLHEFHLLDADGAARLLKTLEEPPASAVFLVLADQVPPELVTIASRCVRIEFGTIPEATVRDVLIAEGASPESAEQAAAGAEGNLTRARVLVTEPRSRPSRSDSTAPAATSSRCAPSSPRSSRPPQHRWPLGRSRRPRRWKRAWRPWASGAAVASNSRNATSESCAGTVSTSCAAASP
jgi:DNA polymerase III subunit delta'